MTLRLAAAILAATWLLWQVAVSATDEVRLPEITAFSSFENAATNTSDLTSLVLYRRTAPGQYTAYGMNATGNIVRSLHIPGTQIQKADQTTISLAGKEGYITAPENGAYYIWYPQIGAQVYVFNEQGAFLWEKDESHYLHALPHGRFILAAAGDHSRMLFMNPDFKVQADFQGILFTHFIVDDNPDLKTAQACLGSLDGEIIIAHLDRKLYFRHRLGYALKSLTCDFESGELAAIVEHSVEIDKKSVQQDFLMHMKFVLSAAKDEKSTDIMRPVSPNLSTMLNVGLPITTVTAAPLIITKDSLCFLQAAPDNTADVLALYYTQGRKAGLKYTPLSQPKMTENAIATNTSPDTWKSAAIHLQNENACLFTHNSGRMLIANGRGILLDRTDLPVQRLVARRDVLYLQNEKGVLTLR